MRQFVLYVSVLLVFYKSRGVLVELGSVVNHNWNTMNIFDLFTMERYTVVGASEKVVL